MLAFVAFTVAGASGQAPRSPAAAPEQRETALTPEQLKSAIDRLATIEYAVRAAAATHSFAGVDHSGTPAILHTTGNPDGHVILRGGSGEPNHGPAGVEAALAKLRGAALAERLVIDASHDNSAKDHERQPLVAAQIGEQVAGGSRAIVGVMLESFLVAGRQNVADGHELTYGQSITDACMDWDATVGVLDGLAAAVRDRRA